MDLKIEFNKEGIEEIREIAREEIARVLGVSLDFLNKKMMESEEKRMME